MLKTKEMQSTQSGILSLVLVNPNGHLSDRTHLQYRIYCIITDKKAWGMYDDNKKMFLHEAHCVYASVLLS